MVRTIELRSLTSEELPAFKAGSHIDIHLPTGLVRSYSLINPENEQFRYVLGVARDRESRGGSTYIHDKLRVGDILESSAPRNQFALNEDAPSSILIAGGIGITPMISMTARLNKLGHDWVLHYAVRNRSEAAFVPDLSKYRERVKLHLDDECGGVLDLKSIIDAAPADAHLYCCGPTPMMEAFGRLTEGFDPGRIHVEHFKPIEDADTSGGFLVKLARSGKTIAVPEGSTILEALANAGIEAPSSCQQGVCGTCETAVLEGTPDHRDSVLTPEERKSNRTMMICCSGALSEKLVLDI